MSLKRIYKQMVPVGVRNRVAGHPWFERLRTQQLVREGERLAAATVAHGADGRIHVTFVVQRLALWCNHASIYGAMKADPAFAVSVIAIPKRPPAAMDLDLAEYRRLMKFLDAKGIAYSKGYDSVGRVWINPLRFGLPDIVFLPQPYAFTQSFLYHSPYLKHFCSLAILNYGVTVADMPYMQYELPVYGDCRFIFVESEAHKELFAAHAPALADRLYVTGHPKLDAYRDPVPPGLALWKCPRACKRIIWAPHFTVTDDRTPHTFSNFFEYYDFFLACAREHPDIEFVMRPHPELFEHMVATGKRTREEALSYWDRFNALPNGQVYEGAEIFTLFRQSDALILDSIGFLAEYAPTGKPICFLDSMRRQRLNPIGERLIHSYYVAWNQEEIREFIQNVVVNGQDVRREERLAIVQHHLFMSGEGAGIRIKDLIKQLAPGVKKSMSAGKTSVR
jgi:hypothetical protein